MTSRSHALFFVFLAVFAAFQLGDALKCNFCVGTLTSDCANNVTSSIAEQTCYSPRDSIPQHTSHAYLHESESEEFAKENEDTSDENRKIDTFCIYLTTKDVKGGGLAERGCGYIYHNVNICKFIKKKFKSVKNCKACKNDNCN